MRTDRRSTAAALAAVCIVLWFVSAGHSSADPGTTHQAWTRTRTVVPFAPTEGNLYIAVTAGGEDARAFLAFDGVGDPARLTLVLREPSDPGAVAAPDTAAVTACALGGPLTASGEITEPPSADCRAQTAAKRNADGTWRVPLAPFRSHWAAGHPAGVVLLPDTAAADETPVTLAEPVPVGMATWRVAWVATETTLVTTSPDAGSMVTPPTTTAVDVAAGVAAGAGRAPTPPTTPLPNGHDPPAPSTSPGTATSPPIFTGSAGTTSAFPPTVRAAARPSAAAALAVAVVVGLLALAVAARHRPEVVAALAPSRWGGHPDTGRQVLIAVAVGVAALAPLGTSEVTIFKLGLVALLAINALGLHVLLNWAGELSLAHAAFTGLPALAVAKLSADHGISVIHLLPVGVVLGAALGTVVGLPSLRARGIQVAIVTLAAGLAVDRFFFTKSWLVGPPQGATIAETTLGPLHLTTQRSLWLFLVACVLLAAAVVRALHASSVGRAWRWLRADPAAAAAFGIAVARYKVAAYAVAGAFAGFGGGLSVVWVERVTAQSFPTTLSFSYLIVVVLAGRGLVGGVLAAAVLLEGGRQFAGGLAGWIDYVGPVALVIVLTRYRAGLTGIGGSLMRIVKDSKFAATGAALERGTDASGDEHLVTSSMVAGCVLIALGFGAIALSWYHIGNTDQLWIHSQELVSGGLGGMAAVIVGAALLIRDQLIRNRVIVIERAATAVAAPAAVATANGGRRARPLRAHQGPAT